MTADDLRYNLACECNSETFRLEPAMFGDGTFVSGTVVVNDEWSVVGWSGVLRCAHCDAELHNPAFEQFG